MKYLIEYKVKPTKVNFIQEVIYDMGEYLKIGEPAWEKKQGFSKKLRKKTKQTPNN